MNEERKMRLAIRSGKKYLPEEYTWDYCIANNIPYILVNPKIKYANVSCDLMSIDFGLIFPTEHSFSDQWEIYYNVYCDSRGLPDDKYSMVGGSNNLVFTIFKEDIPSVVQDLIEQVNKHVKKYGKINLVRREFYEIQTRMNKMMSTLEYSVPWDTEEYDKLNKKLKELAMKMA